jgi:signal peptidase I
LARATKPLRSQGEAFREGPPKERTPLRDNLEWIALAVLVVLLLRQVVVEAFSIKHGSMAPTLQGTHQEVRCPNCSYAFDVGLGRIERDGEAECPNCHYQWDGAARYHPAKGALSFRRPEWLWHQARSADGTVIRGTDAANRVYRGPSRIFVNKFLYRLRKPRRWEVVVFLYPSYSVKCKVCDWEDEVSSLEDFVCPDCGSSHFEVDARDFIKRVVGLPNERVSLTDGDVYVNGKLQRKPRKAQQHLWFHVFDSRFMPEREVDGQPPVFDLPGRWQRVSEGGVLRIDALGAEESVMASYGRPILDYYSYDGLSYDSAPRTLGASGQNEVGDCRVRAKVRILETDAGGGEVLLAVEDAGHDLELSVTAGPAGQAVLSDNGGVAGTSAVRGPRVGESIWLTLENYDDRVVARVDAKEVLSYDYEGSPPGRRGVRFGVRGARVLWEHIIIERDIYYTQAEDGFRPREDHELGPEEYFVLGDNSPASSDSRRWKRAGVPEENFIGKAFLVFWPLHRLSLL